MLRNEYEARQRALELELNADIELLRAGYLAKRKALERLWLAAAEDLPAVSPSETAASETVPSDTVGIETVPSETVRPGRPAPPLLRRGQVMDDLADIFPALPDEFERRDVFRLLGYEPPRATLYRAFAELIGEQMMEIVRFSEGGKRTRYRKLPPPGSDPG